MLIILKVSYQEYLNQMGDLTARFGRETMITC